MRESAKVMVQPQHRVDSLSLKVLVCSVTNQLQMSQHPGV